MLQARGASSYPRSSAATADKLWPSLASTAPRGEGQEGGNPPTMALPNWTATAGPLPQEILLREAQAAPTSPVHASKVTTSSSPIAPTFVLFHSLTSTSAASACADAHKSIR